MSNARDIMKSAIEQFEVVQQIVDVAGHLMTPEDARLLRAQMRGSAERCSSGNSGLETCVSLRLVNSELESVLENLAEKTDPAIKRSSEKTDPSVKLDSD